MRTDWIKFVVANIVWGTFVRELLTVIWGTIA
jgi:hypothetical protein